ncbi:DNA repair protein RadA [Candidatus Xenohaliotis californiensis]|uniref:DNA repair protein RadA n=1 Tax=Candidatus Xenohaliotis californiensis TaxID=84677 RepID=A0ABM9N8P2_9RICK|nr:DNA repair protein RadA [Candidatus Xenohaliotis californiensis]
MKNNKKLYTCTECHTYYSKWAGKCDTCGKWNTISQSQAIETNTASNIVSINEIKKITINYERYKTGCSELDNALGGGIAPGSAILIGGEPGIGKSTLMTQLALNFTNSLYISAEESIEQISIRIQKFKKTTENVFFASQARLEQIISIITKEKNLKFIFIDSIQTIYSNESSSSPGSIMQVRHCAHKIIELVKNYGITLIIISHVNKDGQIAGPKVLEHMVDTVLYFEGDTYNHYRILRTIKNRFGPANEIAVFTMSDQGLNSVNNPSAIFIPEHSANTTGSVIFAGIEGTRPILLEIQALLAPTYMVTPRRAVVGWDINRLAMIVAILSARCGILLSDKEIYLNVAGGFKISETAADMAIAAALLSAFYNKTMPYKTVLFGEISLSGAFRKTAHGQKRIQESKRLGFHNAITARDKDLHSAEIIAINHITKLKSYIEQI